MVKEFAISVSDFGFGVLVVNTFIFLVKYKNIPDNIKLFGLYLMLNFITEIFSKLLFRLHIENLFLLHIYTLLEFITWSLFFRQLFLNKKWVQKIFFWFMGCVSILIIANTLFLEPINGFNSNAKTLVQLILIGYAIFYFFNAFGKIDLRQNLARATSIINFAVIIYYSGSLFIFMVSKLLADQNVADNHQYGYWAINAMLNLIFQILILIGLWTAAFRKTNSL